MRKENVGKKGRILMLMVPAESPVTGGEIYNHKLIEHLKSSFSCFNNISWKWKPYRNAPEFIFNALLQNFSLLRRIKIVDSGTVILEDNSQSSYLFFFNVVTQFMAKLMRRKIAIISLIHHTYAPLMPHGIKGKLKAFDEGLFINSLNGVITVSEFTESSVKKVLKKDVKLVIAPPGLNTSGLDKDPAIRPVNDDISLLFVGYFDSRKGIDTLITAFGILINERDLDRSMLHVVGDTERNNILYRELEDYTKKAGLDGKIIFHGRVSDRELENLYMSADIFVFPSQWEGFGMVLAEAMSYGLPIVTTNAGAIPYLVKNGLNGLLVPPKDPERLAQAIEALIRSPGLRQSFSEANRKAAKEFNWDKSFAKVTNFLVEIGQSLGGYSFL